MIIGSKQIYIKNLPSTNTYILQHLKNKELPEGTIVTTDYQTEGRGQSGNSWESEKGMNLLISILLFPSSIKPDEQFLISIAISLGLCDFLKRYIPSCSIKWPNDIYVNNDKIAGILIENSILGEKIESTIAGIGLNINQRRFISDAPNPVSLSLLTEKQFDLEVCLDQLASDLDKRYKQLLSENFDLIRAEYSLQLYRRNEWCRYRTQSGEFTGRLTGVTDNGNLLIENRKGSISSYMFKEIDFII